MLLDAEYFFFFFFFFFFLPFFGLTTQLPVLFLSSAFAAGKGWTVFSLSGGRRDPEGAGFGLVKRALELFFPASW